MTSKVRTEDKLSRVKSYEAVLHQLARMRCSLRFLVDATSFCAYIERKLDTEDASVRQKQVRNLLCGVYLKP